MLNFTTKVLKSLVDKLHVIGILLDLSKAFDSLNHKILLDNLENIVVRGVAHKLFSNYQSALKYIDKGAPQGLILGPL